MVFTDFFRQATGHDPFPYQVRLAAMESLPHLLDAPTGSGKTAAAVLAWLWRRRHSERASAESRRLVYCLPMRALVDQTERCIREWLGNLGLTEEVGLHVLRGGAIDNSWDDRPERDAILVGTQDQLLSRALNRGYAMSRYRWPIHFAYLHNDVLWVLDETQLMGVGLSTSAQLDAFRRRYKTYGPATSMWMSATLDARRLATIDFRDTPLVRHGLESADREDMRLAPRLSAAKQLHRAETDFQRDVTAYGSALAREVIECHKPDTLTLVIVNRVARAQAVRTAIGKASPSTPVALIHSRFRPADRARLQNEVLASGWKGVVVATQAVEAGVDLSAATLFTELAPWSSLVQRFGRCNRYGEYRAGDVYWLDLPDDDGHAAPYSASDLAAARALLVTHDDVGIQRLTSSHETPNRPTGPVVRTRDLLDLFDTQPDLAGADIDVSPYIRDTSDAGVQVYWRPWEGPEPTFDDQPHEAELCMVPVHELRDLLKKSNEKAFRWDALLGGWEAVDRPVPGMAILLHSRAGGYDADLGWTLTSKRPVERIVRAGSHLLDDDSSDHRSLGAGRFVTLDEHTRDVLDVLRSIIADTFGGDLPVSDLETAAVWHDVGKAHAAFQKLLTDNRPDSVTIDEPGPYAKSPTGRGGKPERQHFRHELASALALLAVGGSSLAAYVAAAHHGKVRLSIRSRPTELQPPGGALSALGIHDGDIIEPFSVADTTVPRIELDLSPMLLGGWDGQPSWLSRSLAILDEFGPFRLAYLESILRSADGRASAALAPAEVQLND